MTLFYPHFDCEPNSTKGYIDIVIILKQIKTTRARANKKQSRNQKLENRKHKTRKKQTKTKHQQNNKIKQKTTEDNRGLVFCFCSFLFCWFFLPGCFFGDYVFDCVFVLYVLAKINFLCWSRGLNIIMNHSCWESHADNEAPNRNSMFPWR